VVYRNDADRRPISGIGQSRMHALLLPLTDLRSTTRRFRGHRTCVGERQLCRVIVYVTTATERMVRRCSAYDDGSRDDVKGASRRSIVHPCSSTEGRSRRTKPRSSSQRLGRSWEKGRRGRRYPSRHDTVSRCETDPGVGNGQVRREIRVCITRPLSMSTPAESANPLDSMKCRVD
jgi:hypothetical protein